MTTIEWELAAICIFVGIAVFLLVGIIARIDQIGRVLNGMAQDSRKGTEDARALSAQADELRKGLSSIEVGIERIDDLIRTEIERRAGE